MLFASKISGKKNCVTVGMFGICVDAGVSITQNYVTSKV